ncbi:MAG: AAA family ATPase [Chryseolinea sp.]
MGTIITFYSYKGGVGRSMALANTGALLASWGKKVLLIDWDLEAPGLENYFKEYIKSDLAKREGLINVLSKRKERSDLKASQIEWNKILVNIAIPVESTLSTSARLDLLMAGQKDSSYIQNVRQLDYDKFYDEHQGGEFLENLREYWISQYDFVLIDSRTGLTDSSGVCSIQMPDILVMLFTATDQGFQGTLEVAKRAVAAQRKLIYDRFKLKLLPVPTRFDSTEFKLQQEWLTRFNDGLKDVYSTWVPDYPQDANINISHRELLDLTKLPYIPYFSYGEKLPVFEHGTKDPQGLGYAYETISALLTHKLEGAKMLVESRGEFVKRAKEGRQPYEEDTSVSQKENLPQPEQFSKSKRGILVGVGLLSLFVVIIVWLTQKKSSSDSELRNDSLIYALQASEFLNEFQNADTSNVVQILDLKKSLFAKTLQSDTSLAIQKVQNSIRRILKNEIEFNLPILYQDIAQRTFDPKKYYADTIKNFISTQNIALSALVSMPGYFDVKEYNNTIESDSIIFFDYDSTGYTVRYIETGNYIPSENGYIKSADRIRVPVIVNLNDDFKIESLRYEQVEKTGIEETKHRIRVDVFTIGELSKLHMFLTESIYEQLQNSPLYLPRKRVLTDAINNQDGYKISQNQIRYNKGEEKYASEIALLITKSTGQKFMLHPVVNITQDYISVFIVDNAINVKRK